MEDYVSKWGEAVTQVGATCGAHSSIGLLKNRIKTDRQEVVDLSVDELIGMTDFLGKDMDEHGVYKLHVNRYFRHMKNCGVGLSEKWKPSDACVSYPRYKVSQYGKIKIDTVITELQAHRPVVGILLVDEFLEKGEKGGVYDNPFDEDVSLPQDTEMHAVLIVDCVGDDHNILVIQNSWSPSWGDSGFYKVTKRTFRGFYTVENVILESSLPIELPADQIGSVEKQTLLQMNEARLEGEQLAGEDRFEEAIWRYDYAVALAPNNPWAANMRSMCYNARAVCIFKLRHLSSMINAKTDGMKLGKHGRFEEARLRFDDALGFAPDMPWAAQLRAKCHFNIALCFSMEGKHQDAIEKYTTALQWNPRYENALFKRAKVYEVVGNYDLAIADVQEILKLDSSNHQATDYLESLVKEKHRKSNA